MSENSIAGEEITMTEFVARDHVGQTKAEVLQVNRRYIITDPLGKTIEIPETMRPMQRVCAPITSARVMLSFVG